MASTNNTPLQLYYSLTATNTPSAGNLVNGELAINTNDGKLYYKDSSGVVQTIASKNSNAGIFSANTGQLGFPVGTTAQRSALPQAGFTRYNSTTNQFEGYTAINGAAISTITFVTTTATVTTATAHGLSTGNVVTVSGATPAAYNGTFSITVTNSTTFTYTMLSNPGANASPVGSYTTGVWGSLGSLTSVSNGGTGLSSITPNSVLTGGSTSTSNVVPVRPGKLGNLLTSTAGSTVSVGSFVIGVQYSILTLGTTTNAQWNTIAGTSAVTYEVGSTFTCANIGTGLGDGTAQITTWTSATPATSITPTSGTAPYFGARAFASFSTVTYANIAATYIQSAFTVTLTVASHAYQVGHYIYVDRTTGSAVDGLYVVTAVTPTTITYTAGSSLSTSGNITIRQCSIYAGSQNVANVVYESTGTFVVNFTTPMPFANYVALGSCGTNNGGSASSGDDNMMAFGNNADTGIRTTQSIRGYTTDSGGSGYQNASLNSVTIFA
jgi:hypothetical protein